MQPIDYLLIFIIVAVGLVATGFVLDSCYFGKRRLRKIVHDWENGEKQEMQELNRIAKKFNTENGLRRKNGNAAADAPSECRAECGS